MLIAFVRQQQFSVICDIQTTDINISMKQKSNQSSKRKLQIFISDSSGEEEENRNNISASALQDKLTCKQTPIKKSIKYEMSLGLNLLQIFSKAVKKRLRMESFMRIKLVYSLHKRNDGGGTSQSFSSRSANKFEGYASRHNNILSSSLLDSREESPAQNRGRLMNNIMGKLHSRSNGKVEVERISQSMDKRLMERNVSNKIDNLERILRDIKKCKQQNVKRPTGYAKKRARAKGQKFIENQTYHNVKPLSAIIVRTEPDIEEVEPRKLERSIIAKIDMLQDNISPISQKTENSSILLANEVEQSQKVAQKKFENQNFKQKQNLAEQLHRISRQLNELRKLNEQCLKHTLIRQNQTKYHDQPYKQPLFAPISTYNKPETARVDPVNQHPYLQRPPQPIWKYRVTEDFRNSNGVDFSYKVTNPQHFKKRQHFNNSLPIANFKKPSTQSHIQYKRNPQIPYGNNIHQRGRRLATQPSNPLDQPQFSTLSPNTFQNSSIKIPNYNSQSNIVYEQQYRHGMRPIPARAARFNSSGSHLVDNHHRVLVKGYQNQSSQHLNRQYIRQF